MTAKATGPLIPESLIAEGLALEQEFVRRLVAASPVVRKGLAFKPGKPEGAAGPIPRAIATYLRKHPKASAAEVWIALHDRPPKGYTFVDNPRLGKYIEHGAATVMQYPRFQTVVSERRPAKAKRAYKRA